MKHRAPSAAYLSTSPQQTILCGESIARVLAPGDIVALRGELGAGKTILIKGICRGLQVRENVTSSSFVLLRLMHGICPVHHFDLYRLDTPEELSDIGFEEYLFSEGVSLIEWAEKLGGSLGDGYLEIELHYVPQREHCRTIILTPRGDRLGSVLEKLEIPLEKMD